jgi:hypothetical protein
VLKPKNHALATSDALVAEHSRPKRQVVKEERQSNAQTRGRNRVKEHKPAVHTFWQSPFLWPYIARTVQIVGWNPSVIANYLHKSQPKHFGGLRRQVVERWIEEDGNGQRRWNQSTLDRVKRGQPVGNVTRVGILVRLQDYLYVCLASTNGA